MTVCQYLVVRAQLSECVQTLLQLCDHAAWQLPTVRDLLAEGAVVLNQTQNVAAIAIGPHPVARHQARGSPRDAVSRAAADHPSVQGRLRMRFFIFNKKKTYPGYFWNAQHWLQACTISAQFWWFFFLTMEDTGVFVVTLKWVTEKIAALAARWPASFIYDTCKANTDVTWQVLQCAFACLCIFVTGN